MLQDIANNGLVNRKSLNRSIDYKKSLSSLLTLIFFLSLIFITAISFNFSTTLNFPTVNATTNSESYVFLKKWGTQGTGDGQFVSPSSITVDTSGNVYVLDTSNNRIQKFDSNGTFITQWGSLG